MRARFPYLLTLAAVMLVTAGLLVPSWHGVGHAQHAAEHRAEHAAHHHTDGPGLTTGLPDATHTDLACVLCAHHSLKAAPFRPLADALPSGARLALPATERLALPLLSARSIRGPPAA